MRTPDPDRAGCRLVDGMAVARDGDKWRNVGLGLILGLAVWPVVAINRRLGALKNKRD